MLCFTTESVHGQEWLHHYHCLVFREAETLQEYKVDGVQLRVLLPSLAWTVATYARVPICMYATI